MRWAQGGGGCMRSCRSALPWRGDGTGFQPPAAAPADERGRWRRRGGSPPPDSTQPATSTPTPPADTQPPGRVRHLRAITSKPGRITLVWTNPGANDLAGIVVRRGWARLPHLADRRRGRGRQVGAHAPGRHGSRRPNELLLRRLRVRLEPQLLGGNPRPRRREPGCHTVAQAGHRPHRDRRGHERGAGVAQPGECRPRLRRRAPRPRERLPDGTARRRAHRWPGAAHDADRHHRPAGGHVLLPRLRAELHRPRIEDHVRDQRHRQ